MSSPNRHRWTPAADDKWRDYRLRALQQTVMVASIKFHRWNRCEWCDSPSICFPATFDTVALMALFVSEAGVAYNALPYCGNVVVVYGDVIGSDIVPETRRKEIQWDSFCWWKGGGWFCRLGTRPPEMAVAIKTMRAIGYGGVKLLGLHSWFTGIADGLRHPFWSPILMKIPEKFNEFPQTSHLHLHTRPPVWRTLRVLCLPRSEPRWMANECREAHWPRTLTEAPWNEIVFFGKVSSFYSSTFICMESPRPLLSEWKWITFNELTRYASIKTFLRLATFYNTLNFAHLLFVNTTKKSQAEAVAATTITENKRNRTKDDDDGKSSSSSSKEQHKSLMAWKFREKPNILLCCAFILFIFAQKIIIIVLKITKRCFVCCDCVSASVFHDWRQK